MSKRCLTTSKYSSAKKRKLLKIESQNLNELTKITVSEKIQECKTSPLFYNIELDLYNDDIDDTGIKFLFEEIKKLGPRIRSLNLNKNQITDEGAFIIADFLENNHELEELSLGNNKITTVGATAILYSLNRNKTLKKLLLWDNDINNIGIARPIAKIINYNTTLEHIEFNKNQLGDKVLSVICRAIENNQSLNHVGFGGCRITDDSTVLLAKSLKNNTSLTELNLQKNDIRDIGAQAIIKLLERNYTLREINIISDYYKPKGLDRIDYYCTRNNSIHKKTEELYQTIYEKTEKLNQNQGKEIDKLIDEISNLSIKDLISESGYISCFSFYNSVHPKIYVYPNYGGSSVLIDKKASESISQRLNKYFFVMSGVCKKFVIHTKDDKGNDKEIMLPVDIIGCIARYLKSFDIKHLNVFSRLIKDISEQQQEYESSIHDIVLCLKEKNSPFKEGIKIQTICDFISQLILTKKIITLSDLISLEGSYKILNKLDKEEYSPISRSLYSGNDKILEIVEDCIKRNLDKISQINKTDMKNDFNNILTILEFSQFENLTVEDCIERFVVPLYDSNVIEEFKEILLGEDKSDDAMSLAQDFQNLLVFDENISFEGLSGDIYNFEESIFYVNGNL